MIPESALASMASSLSMFVANLVLAEISEHRAVKGDVNRLKKNYERVALMMASAERRVALDDQAATYWLKRVTDHMYQVQIVVDQWVIKNEKMHREGSLKRTISCGDHSGVMKLAAAMKELNADFDSILELSAETNKTRQPAAVRSYGKTAPGYNADIVGDYVDSDARGIIELLHSSKRRSCRLIAIVGPVGIGKTTLARRIYHSVDAQRFETKLWIRFSNDLSSLIIWPEPGWSSDRYKEGPTKSHWPDSDSRSSDRRKEGPTRSHWPDSECWSSDRRWEGPTKSQLMHLGAEIASKRFLLVVDSVWTEDVWEALLEGPLQQGDLEGSRVIVTTRNKHVARRIGAGLIHHVRRMSNADALRLLFRRASVSESDEAELQDVGRRIVEKCDGLPLAVRSVGRTLRGQEPTRHDWETACRAAFQDLSPEEQYTIGLSFRNLPPHMRQCFLYCSVFPEGFFIEKQYVEQQWISEGFILNKRRVTMEEAAERCFDELVGRGLLRLAVGSDGATGARMPIVIRSFAKDVSDHVNFCTESVSAANNLFEVRRLSIVENNEADDRIGDGDDSGNGEIAGGGDGNGSMEDEHGNRGEARIAGEDVPLHGLGRMKCLRTLVLRKSTVSQKSIRAVRQLNLLRVLDLRGVQGISALPIAVGSLEHLRYLNISETEIERVPGSISYLTMLQYLLLRNCSKVKTLPTGIQQLRYLRCLDIAGTGIKAVDWSFSAMEELVSMQGFPVTRGDGVVGSLRALNLKFPKKLAALRLDMLQEILEPLPRDRWPVREYQQLRDLELCYANADSPLVQGGTIENRMLVLDRFVPEKRLVRLKIENYLGKQYPSWIAAATLPNLQRLHLQSCAWCEELPPLGELPQLKLLAVTGFDSLRSLGAEFRQGGNGPPVRTTAFRRLQQLFIGDMKALHTWSGLQSQDLPQLQVLRLLGCVKLVAIPLVLQESATLTRLEVDTRTKTVIEDKLRGFTGGIVVNVDNTWEQEPPQHEADVAPQDAQPPGPGQDEAVEAEVEETVGALQKEVPKAFELGAVKLVLTIFAITALCSALYLLFVPRC